MALKDLVVDRYERTAMEIVKPVWDDLGPFQLQKLMEDIVGKIKEAEMCGYDEAMGKVERELTETFDDANI